MTSEPFMPLIRSQLLLAGVRPAFIQSQVRSKRWSRLHDGFYLDEGLSDVERVRAERLTHLARAGSGSALSHFTAARLHGFDLPRDVEQSEWISVPAGLAHFSYPGLTVRRTGTLRSSAVVALDGIAVTSRARTVIDVGEMLSINDLEVVVESSLRGIDPRQPDHWREDVLAELMSLSRCGRTFRGAAKLAQVLARRPDGCRPTGSFAETRMLQALRKAGVSDVLRQPTVSVSEPDRRYPDVFPDFIVPRRRLILEVDGKHHLEPDQYRKDLIRQNRLLKGFTVLRCTGLDAVADPRDFVREVVLSPLIECEGAVFDWTVGDRTVRGEGNSWVLRPASINR
jgi:very-short-patch-repair endonuclease